MDDSLDIEAGVPQGSILGPLLYIIFTNDLPETIHDHLSKNQTYFNNDCKSCGKICCFADDSTYTKSSKNPQELKENIDDKYKEISNYMSMNKLVLNSDKTHLIVLVTANQHCKHKDYGITLNTGSEIIEPESSEKLLGGFISSDFKFTEHIMNNKSSLCKLLTSRVNALSKVCRACDFKTRKILADGMVQSLLIYLIQLWGGSSGYLLQFLQVLQNRAARKVTKLAWRTSTQTLLNQCGWLSVKQLVEYHSLLLTYKVKSEGKPLYLKDKLCRKFSYNTRLAAGDGIRYSDRIKHELYKTSFIPRVTVSWNNLPNNMRQSKNIEIFKKDCKAWILSHIPIK